MIGISAFEEANTTGKPPPCKIEQYSQLAPLKSNPFLHERATATKTTTQRKAREREREKEAKSKKEKTWIK
jgi:hypothetical protein